MAKSPTRNILFKFLGDQKSLEKATRATTKNLGRVEKSSGGANRSLGILKKGAAALGGVLAVGMLFKGLNTAIGQASSFEESINAVEVSTGAASAEIMRLGETAAQSLGLSRTAVNKAAVAFAAFGDKITGVEGASADVFKVFITRAVDFASVMDLEVNDALLKFQSGLAGESEPLRRFGIDLSAASVNAFAYANGIAESKAQLTEAQKVQARYGLLLEQTDKFAGDFANTSEGLANQQRILNAEWENAQVLLGEKMLPAMTKVTSAAVDGLEAMDGWFLGAGLVAQGISKVIDRATDLAGLGLMTDMWTDADEALFQFTKTLQFARDRLADGAVAAEVAADWMAHLAGKTVITDRTWDAMRDTVGLTAEEMDKAARRVIANADAWGLNADAVDTLRGRLGFFGDGLAPVIGQIEDWRERTDEAASATDDAAGAVKNLADEHRKLIDPIFRLTKAQEKYDKVLKDVTADGVLATEEADRLAQAHLDLKAATEAVTPEAMEAYKQVISDVRAGVIADFGLIQDSMANLGSETALQRAEAFLDRVEGLTAKPIIIDLSGLKVASRTDIERTVTSTLLKMQRRGLIRHMWN